MSRTAVIFDLGQVLLEWFPERAIEQVLPAAEVPAFFERVGFFAWNAKLDAGGSFAEAEEELVARFPDDREAILAYRRNFDLTVPGYVPGTLALLDTLRRHDITVGALSNWSAETFTGTRDRFDALERFDALVVSGIDGVIKPEPASFALACDRLGVEPANAVFIDDSVVNVAAARAYGLTALLFTGAERLRDDLAALGLPVPDSLDVS
jgi:2-haloacid dehalogenase